MKFKKISMIKNKYSILRLLLFLIISLSFSIVNIAQTRSIDHSSKIEQSKIVNLNYDKSSTLYFGEPEIIYGTGNNVTIICHPPYVYICVWIHDYRDSGSEKTIILNDDNFTVFKVTSNLEINHGDDGGTKITFKNK